MSKISVRHLARRGALQLLYALNYSDQSFEATEEGFLKGGSRRRKSLTPFARELALKTFEQRESLDAEISPVLRHWKLERLALTDRLCLRMGLCEMRSFPDIPLRVTLNEYIELAREFGGDDSPKYVNGVLDRLAQNFKEKDFQAPRKAKPNPGDLEVIKGDDGR